MEGGKEGYTYTLASGIEEARAPERRGHYRNGAAARKRRRRVERRGLTTKKAARPVGHAAFVAQVSVMTTGESVRWAILDLNQ